MIWHKRGIIFVPNQQFPWMKSHAQVPIAYAFNDRIRIFFSTRNAEGKSQIAAIDLNSDNPSETIELLSSPVLELGHPGTFDADGVMPSCVIQKDNELWMYYTGWSQQLTTPYHNSIGLAISKDNGRTFQRLSEGPIIDRSIVDPLITVTPYILPNSSGYTMWYGSGVAWTKLNDKFECTYVIKSASSQDGIHWEKNGNICIPSHHPQEALCTPTVIQDNDHYKMWYSYRNNQDYHDGSGSYRIGYAESQNGTSWERKDDQAGITISTEGWDSTMICYPNILKYHSKWYLFYNGNSFGRSGFGYAST